MPDLTVAAIQMDAAVGAVEANLAHAASLVEQAVGQGAQLIVLPELFNTGYEYTDRNFALVEPLDGRTGCWIADTARRWGVHLAGAFPAHSDGRDYITAMLAAPDGRRWLYRKVHVSMWENYYFERGSGPLVADTDLGRIGLLICWDEIFSDLARAYQGRVDLLCIPSSPPNFEGDVENAAGQVLVRQVMPHALGVPLDAVKWFRCAQEMHARSAGVPLVYAARCGTFHSPIPDGLTFLLSQGLRNALRVLRAAGTNYRLRCPLQGRSAILDARGQRIVQAGQDEEAVLVTTVRPGAPDPAALPPLPTGRTLVPGIPWTQLLIDDVLIRLGRRYRRRRH